MYYEIINERYKRKAPIILVQMKMNIPYLKNWVCADRLLGMANDYLIEVEGESYRR